MLRGDNSGVPPVPPATAATRHAAACGSRSIFARRIGLSFDAWYRRDADLVWRYLQRMGVAPAALDDAVQDVFITAYRRIATFAGESERAWLIGIARRIADRYRRGERRTIRRHEALEAEPVVASRAPDDLDDELSRRVLRERITGFLASLDDDKREIFAGHLAGLRAPEIADALGINLNTVYTRLRRAQHAFVRSFGIEAPIEVEPMPRAAKQRVLALVFARLPIDTALAGATASAGASSWALFGLATAMLFAQPAIDRAPGATSAVEPAAIASALGETTRRSPVAPPLHARADAIATPPIVEIVRDDEVVPPPRRPARARNAATAPASPAPALPAPPSTDALADEVALVNALRDAIGRDDLATARTVLAQHRARFPGGALRREVDRLAAGLGSERIARQVETTGATPSASPPISAGQASSP